MKRDFLAAFAKPARLGRQLRKLTVGSAIAAVAFLSGIPAASAATSTTGSAETGNAVIVERTKKAPKLLLKLGPTGRSLSSGFAQHTSHASHSSHSSHGSHSSHNSHSSHYSGN